MTELAGIIAAIVPLLALLGAGIRFLWNKIEARFVAVETALDECHEREARSHERRAVQLTVIEILWQEIQRIAPKSQVLVRAKHHLDELKAIGVTDAKEG
jgi:putative protein kinase ArgK-like GTPase of G3E family